MRLRRRALKAGIELGTKNEAVIGTEAKKQFPHNIDTFFARASILATLLRSQLALPLLYPLNRRGATPQDALRLARNTPWDDDPATLVYGLSQIAPAVSALSRISSLMDVTFASHHIKARSHEAKNSSPVTFACASKLPQTRNAADYRSASGPHRYAQKRRTLTSSYDSIHRLRHRIWDQRQPHREAQTVHFGWRTPGPRPKLAPRPR